MLRLTHTLKVSARSWPLRSAFLSVLLPDNVLPVEAAQTGKKIKGSSNRCFSHPCYCLFYDRTRLQTHPSPRYEIHRLHRSSGKASERKPHFPSVRVSLLCCVFVRNRIILTNTVYYGLTVPNTIAASYFTFKDRNTCPLKITSLKHHNIWPHIYWEVVYLSRFKYTRKSHA